MDTGMVGMAGDVSVGNTASHPHGTFVGFAFADKFHHPYLVGVGDRK